MSATVYVTSIEDWGTVDAIIADLLGDHRPARAVVAVERLHLGARIAVQMIAAVLDGAGATGEIPKHHSHHT